MKGKKFQSQSHIDVEKFGQKPLVDVSDNTHLLTEKDDEDQDSNEGKEKIKSSTIKVGRLQSQDSDNEESDLRSNLTNPLGNFIKF